MSEAWKPVVGFEGLYEVAPCGAIRNSRTLRWLSPSVKDDGYTSVKLFKDGVTCCSCPVDLDACHNFEISGELSCEEILLDWLKSPVEEVDNG